MYALFLETKAAIQCDRYAERHGLDAEELKRRAYSYAGFDKFIKRDDAWWVGRCLENDSHKDLDIMNLFIWYKTPEGNDFWSKVHRERV